MFSSTQHLLKYDNLLRIIFEDENEVQANFFAKLFCFEGICRIEQPQPTSGCCTWATLDQLIFVLKANFRGFQ